MVDERKIMNGENWSTRRKTSPSATLSTTSHRRTWDRARTSAVRASRQTAWSTGRSELSDVSSQRTLSVLWPSAIVIMFRNTRLSPCRGADVLEDKDNIFLIHVGKQLPDYTLTWRRRQTALTHSRLLLTWMIYKIQSVPRSKHTPSRL